MFCLHAFSSCHHSVPPILVLRWELFKHSTAYSMSYWCQKPESMMLRKAVLLSAVFWSQTLIPCQLADPDLWPFWGAQQQKDRYSCENNVKQRGGCAPSVSEGEQHWSDMSNFSNTQNLLTSWARVVWLNYVRRGQFTIAKCNVYLAGDKIPNSLIGRRKAVLQPDSGFIWNPVSGFIQCLRISSKAFDAALCEIWCLKIHLLMI